MERPNRKPDHEVESFRAWIDDSPKEDRKAEWEATPKVKYQGMEFGLNGFTTCNDKIIQNQFRIVIEFVCCNKFSCYAPDNAPSEILEIINVIKNGAKLIGYQTEDMRDQFKAILNEMPTLDQIGEMKKVKP